MSDKKNANLANFFSTVNKKKKREGRTGNKRNEDAQNEEVKQEQQVEEQAPADQNTANLPVDQLADFDLGESDDDDTLLITAPKIKDLNEERAKQKREEDLSQQKGGWDIMRNKSPDQQQIAPAVKPDPVKKNTTGPQTISFNKGPTQFFNNNKKKTAISNQDFPDMDANFPTLDNNSGKKAEEPAVNKCNQPQIGSWSTATAKQPRPAGDEKTGTGGGIGGGMNFSKKAPMFTRSTKPKTVSSPEQESLDGKQNYDFSKMRMAAVSVRKPREEGDEGWSRTEDSEEKKHEMHERPREKRVPQPFNMNAPVIQAADPDQDEDGFTVVQASKRVTKAPARATATTWKEPTAPSKKKNPFGDEDWQTA